MSPSVLYVLFILFCLVDYIQSQTGEGCSNRHIPCEPGQIRVNALYSPTTNTFVGGCYCNCEMGKLQNPSSPSYCSKPKVINFDYVTKKGDCSCKCPTNLDQPSDCISPQIHNKDTCMCECPGGKTHGQCLPDEFWNDRTCRCECTNEMGLVGQECVTKKDGNDQLTLAHSLVLPDCTCECPNGSPSKTDCKSMGMWYKACKCFCPIEACPGGYQVLDKRTCSCQCPRCKPDEILVNEYTCECALVEVEPTGPNVRYCCHPYYYDFDPYFGKCWGKTDEKKCNDQTGKCIWYPNNCFNGRPQCKFEDYKCTQNNECCSKVCRYNGLCR